MDKLYDQYKCVLFCNGEFIRDYVVENEEVSYLIDNYLRHDLPKGINAIVMDRYVKNEFSTEHDVWKFDKSIEIELEIGS